MTRDLSSKEVLPFLKASWLCWLRKRRCFCQTTRTRLIRRRGSRISWQRLLDAKIRIYAASGELVRTLVLGYQSAGVYQSRSQAAYWDGKNELGEPVASGIYFYTLSAGRFTATRRLVIRK